MTHYMSLAAVASKIILRISIWDPIREAALKFLLENGDNPSLMITVKDALLG